MGQKLRWTMFGVLIVSLFVASAYLPQGNREHAGLTFQKINNTVAVYYIGGRMPEYFLNATRVTEFRKIKTPHILVVEGQYVGNNMQVGNFIRGEVFSGVPVIAIDSPELFNGVFEGQFYPRVVDGQGPDGTPLRKEKEHVYGYVTYPLPDGRLVTKVFISIDPGPGAIKDAYEWALANLRPEAGSLEVQPLSSGAYWGYVGQLDITTGDSWKPYGRLNIRTTYYKIIDDGSTAYDWYTVHVRQQSVPGEELWGSGWRTADMYTWMDADYYNSNGFLPDYAPTTTSGTASVGVSVLMRENAWSYSLPDVLVYDQSDYSLELARWWHDIPEDKQAGSKAYQIEPGATLRFPAQESKVWREHYGVRFGKPKWWGLRWCYTREGWVEVQISMG